MNGSTARAGWPVQLGHADKMDAVARLAGGLSHDVGNLVDEAAVAVRDAMVTLPQSSPTQDALEQAAATLQRASMIARQLAGLAESRAPRPEPRNLATTIQELLPLATRLAGPAVRLDLEPLDGETLVRAGAGQLEQVVFHLVVNARDAMPEGGVLTIAARRDRLEVPQVHRYGVLPTGEWCVLAVRDTGRGMSEAVLGRLFEPFFTTKAPGMGSGLGLATVYGIAQQLGGQVLVDSAEGQGTTIALWLPRAVDAAARAGDAAVLVVQADAWLRALSARALRRGGYRVLEAANGAEALALLDDIAGQQVEVVLAEGNLPGLAGEALAAAIAERRPGIRVVITTGRVDPEPTQRPGPLVRLLRAPFTPHDLLAAVAAG